MGLTRAWVGVGLTPRDFFCLVHVKGMVLNTNALAYRRSFFRTRLFASVAIMVLVLLIIAISGRSRAFLKPVHFFNILLSIVSVLQTVHDPPVADIERGFGAQRTFRNANSNSLAELTANNKPALYDARLLPFQVVLSTLPIANALLLGLSLYDEDLMHPLALMTILMLQLVFNPLVGYNPIFRALETSLIQKEEARNNNNRANNRANNLRPNDAGAPTNARVMGGANGPAPNNAAMNRMIANRPNNILARTAAATTTNTPTNNRRSPRPPANPLFANTRALGNARVAANVGRA